MSDSKDTITLKNRINLKWQERSIKEKLRGLVTLVFIIILMSVVLDVWTVKLSLWDFRFSLAANEKAGNVVQCLEAESIAFKNFTRGNLSQSDLNATIYATNKAIKALPSDYYRIGSERLAWSQKIVKSYSIYKNNLDLFLTIERDNPEYIAREYELYEMQDYLKSYSGTLLSLSTVAVNQFYLDRFPLLFLFPVIIFVISVTMIFIVAKASNNMSVSLVDPLLKLANASKKIASNDIYIDDIVVDNKDEIGDLVHAFNKMKFATGEYISALEANRVALDKLHIEELQKKEIENQLERMKFEVLRHQINPHFLFNTLNVISGMACLEDAKTTDKMIKALSSLLRYNLRTEEKETTLELEINVMNDYMYLQKMRFGDRIKYEIECDNDLYCAVIPTFVLQPIVENGIVHGISHKEEGGYIRIKAEKLPVENEDDRLLITVADTGVGMDEDELNNLRDKMNVTDVTRKAIGISNIYRRIKLMYKDSDIEISSKKGEGTIFKITLPLIRPLEV